MIFLLEEIVYAVELHCTWSHYSIYLHVKNLMALEEYIAFKIYFIMILYMRKLQVI